MKLPDVQIGDVWQSDGGCTRIVVDAITAIGSAVTSVHWTGIKKNGQRAKRNGVCYLQNFAAKRRLVERDGKAVAA